MDFAHLALVCLVAILGPALSLSKVVRVPVVIGFVLGATGFGILRSEDPVFSFLAEIGFVLVMFVAGSAVPIEGIVACAKSGRPLVRALLVGVLAVPMGIGLAHVIGSSHGALYAVLIASSSASIVLPMLEGVTNSGRSLTEMIPQIAVADAACIVLLPLVADRANLGRSLLGTGLVLGGGLVGFVLLDRLEKTGAQRAVHDVSGERGLALELRFLLTAVFALAALAEATAAQMGVPIAAVAMLLRSGTALPGESAAILLGAVLTIAATALLSGPVHRIAEDEAAALA
ncbi:cation:proton antiporter [Actinomyces culturomici]|uniref:cation:proton antiporter n=1 Tax=Actinomyces culturomici TaxID=1926276 RepID=UPI000E207C8D|nr:cation:proton antiporter [Actinomyces culturomici]